MAGVLPLRVVHRCIEIVDECAESWLDTPCWEMRAVEGIRELVGGCVSVFAVSQIRGGLPAALDTCVTNDDPRIVQVFLDYLHDGGLRWLPEAPVIAPILFREGATSYVQSDLISRKDYHGSIFYQRYMRSNHIEDAVSSVALDAGGLAVGVTVGRCKGDPPFSDQDRATVELFNKLLATRIGKPLATSYHISASTLSPRLRAALAALIEGDSEKLLARRLKISPCTAHEYAAAIYRHFRVRGRTDLMAYLLKREPRLLQGPVSR